MKCKYDNNKLKFRTPKKDSRGYLRLVCLRCGRNYKASNNKYSHPFEARPRKPDGERRIHISGRREKNWVDAVVAKHGSFQKWLDDQPLS